MRSRRTLDGLGSGIPWPGVALDIGTGLGAPLRELGVVSPTWELEWEDDLRTMMRSGTETWGRGRRERV